MKTIELDMYQATAVAALCKKATELNITIPWLCDIGGETSGRINVFW